MLERIGMLFTIGLAGCVSGGGSGGGGGSDGGVNPAAARNCQSRCEAKVTSCGTTAADAAAYCENEICAYTPTEAQLTCGEAATCQALEAGTDGCEFGDPGACPTLTCECENNPFQGTFEHNGQCVETCDEACGFLED
jgi:hypothetical protein